MAHVHCMLGTLEICNTYCFSTATIFAQKRLNVTSYLLKFPALLFTYINYSKNFHTKCKVFLVIIYFCTECNVVGRFLMKKMSLATSKAQPKGRRYIANSAFVFVCVTCMRFWVVTRTHKILRGPTFVRSSRNMNYKVGVSMQKLRSIDEYEHRTLCRSDNQ